MQEIVHKREFNAGNFWGKWSDDEGQGEYQVYSYRQCIGTFYLADEKWILDSKKYSMTTLLNTVLATMVLLKQTFLPRLTTNHKKENKMKAIVWSIRLCCISTGLSMLDVFK